jgi:hypothetical protein
VRELLRRLFARFWRRPPQRSSRQTRSAETRARFWEELREGEREAERASLSERSRRERHRDDRHRQPGDEPSGSAAATTTIRDAPS